MLEPASVPFFYANKRFSGETGRRVLRSSPGPEVAVAHGPSGVRAELHAYFNEATFERHGVLHGEYLLLPDGLSALDRAGIAIKINSAAEDRSGAVALDRQIRSDDYASFAQDLVSRWDTFPVVDGLPVLSDKYSTNYYHFSLELVPRLRFLEARPDLPVIVPGVCLSRPFQVDLLERALHGRVVAPLTGPVRVRDPILSCDMASENGFGWMRRAVGLAASTGSRRIYLRRSGRGTRSTGGGGLREDDAFAALLRRFGFETVEFGDGTMRLAEQVALLEGAGTVLAAHGAGLTNLLYLKGEATVVEILGLTCARACYMHLCAFQGFRYRGFVSTTYDAAGDIAVDADALAGLLESLG